jgi:hypothetical protein
MALLRAWVGFGFGFGFGFGSEVLVLLPVHNLHFSTF